MFIFFLIIEVILNKSTEFSWLLLLTLIYSAIKSGHKFQKNHKA